MKFTTLLRRRPEWMEHDGPCRDIVLTSRIRLARNLDGPPFPGWAKKENRVEIMEQLRPRVESLSVMKDCFSEDLANLDAIKKQVLVEKHLISREQAAKSGGCAAVINRDQSYSIMINEEDHLRMQSIRSGLDLTAAHAGLDRLDTELEDQVPFAWDRRFGYLTACPTNLGTGMRASAMLHLPALVLCDQVTSIINAANKIGLAVRGLYGEGTEALSNLFQVSNQRTLGDSEAEILARLEKVIRQIITHERNARRKLLEDNPQKVCDNIGRAYAALRFAHIMESKEALTHLSMLRLGTDVGVFPAAETKLIDTLLLEIQPAHLQIASQKKLTAEERDILRAETLRRRLTHLPEPDMRACQEPDGPAGGPDAVI
ncbi:MAG: protein arginine kinase [Verrucomicrobiaceae bacterium]|nr:MAG: protein arginine kinase [Verrucomicrobiaceae bacterium]